MNDVSDWEICDEHEQSFPRHGFCKDCRIAELQAQIEAVKGLPDKWREEANDRYPPDAFDCASMLDKALEQGEGDG